MLKQSGPFAAALLVAFTIGACGSAAAPGPSAGPAATPRATPTAVPGQGGSGSGISDPGTGGGSGGNTGGGSNPGNGGGGIIIPIPGDPNQNPLVGNANYVIPTAGLVNQHPISVQLVRAAINDDGLVAADLRWWSGIAPCNQLDSVQITRDDAARTISLKVIEGSGPGNDVCIEIAELRATVVDLGKLASGSWTISAEGDAPAITLDVP